MDNSYSIAGAVTAILLKELKLKHYSNNSVKFDNKIFKLLARLIAAAINSISSDTLAEVRAERKKTIFFESQNMMSIIFKTNRST